MSKIVSRGLGKKALFVIIIIVVGGVAVGFFTDNRTLNSNPTFDTSQGAASLSSSFGAVPLTSNPYDYSQGLGSAVSSSTMVSSVTTVMATQTMTAGTSSAADGTTVIHPNTSPEQGASTPTSNTSASSGFIEFFSNVTLQVSSTQASLNKVIAVAYTYGGYVAFSSFNNYSSVAVIRVPASNYQSALTQIEELGNLSGFQTNSNDVAVQYTDLNATLQSLISEQASLLNLENRSTSLNSTLIIENELQGVNTQINEI